MREKKFRAWVKNGWKGMIGNCYQKVDYILGDGSEACIGGSMVRLPSDFVAIEQSTGVSDRNDKEVYEGDIVRVALEDHLHDHDEDCDQPCETTFDCEYGEKRSVIEWSESGGYFLPTIEQFEDEYNYTLGSSEPYVFEVIGNKWEHPDLLTHPPEQK